MVFNFIKCTLKNKCNMNSNQINLTVLSMFSIIIQGIGFYFMDKEKMRMNLFVLVIIFGFIYNIVYFKTYIN